MTDSFVYSDFSYYVDGCLYSVLDVEFSIINNVVVLRLVLICSRNDWYLPVIETVSSEEMFYFIYGELTVGVILG